MSHFTVLVVGEDPESKLAPFHEFECTGIKDQYVQDIDITEEARKEYEAATEHQVVAPDGTTFSYWDDRCYREMTDEERQIVGPIGGCGCCKIGSYTSKDWGDGQGYRAKLHCVPEGYTEQTVPVSEVHTFAEWATHYYSYKTVESPDELGENHKYGYIRVEDGEVRRIVKCTNPNSHWDWYVLGGRWGNYFLLKDGSRSSIAQKGDIDFDAMMQERAEQAAERWSKVHNVIAGRPIPHWETFRQAYKDIDEARDAWHAQEILADFRKLDLWLDIEDFDCTEEDYCEEAALSAIPTFALILDGKWYERGEMGWWAIVKDEKDAKDWAEQFNNLIAGLPDDTLLSVYDCHI